MFQLIYRLLAARWFRRALVLLFGTGVKLLRVLLPEAAGEWERLGDVESSARGTALWRTMRIVRHAAREASEDDLTLLASSLAFYIMLSLAPLVLVLFEVANMISPVARHEVLVQVNAMFGPQAGDLLKALVTSIDLSTESGVLNPVLGVLVLFFGVAGVFSQLQEALNRIWDVRARPASRLWPWFHKRLLSLALFVLMAVVVALAALAGPLLRRLVGEPTLAALLNQIASFAALTVVFGLTFRYIPDIGVPWRQTWTGAITTSLLFLLGRYAISLYLIHGGVATPYGAAGTFVVLLLGCFYGSIIIFLGAEITQVYARLSDLPLVPEPHATATPVRQG